MNLFARMTDILVFTFQDKTRLPWLKDTTPLMLAPMQGVTNRAMRGILSTLSRPDVLFTEFVRVSGNQQTRLATSDRREISSRAGVPLVVQLIGSQSEALVAAAEQALAVGAEHLNLNLGCPYGRMTTSLTGGRLLQRPDIIAALVPALRKVIGGSFSVKLRAGYDDHQTVFELLPVFEAAGIDFLILHPRTVLQNYTGSADHRVTQEVVSRTRLPVIANGDIRTASEARRVLELTGAAGLMLGRGAVADPLLFARIRGEAPGLPNEQERLQLLQRFMLDVVREYSLLFCGEKQILTKIKGVLTAMEEPLLQYSIGRLKKAKSLAEFKSRLDDVV